MSSKTETNKARWKVIKVRKTLLEVFETYVLNWARPHDSKLKQLENGYAFMYCQHRAMGRNREGERIRDIYELLKEAHKQKSSRRNNSECSIKVRL